MESIILHRCKVILLPDRKEPPLILAKLGVLLGALVTTQTAWGAANSCLRFEPRALVIRSAAIARCDGELPSTPAGQAAAAAPNLNDHGTFEIFTAGVSVGTETFEIRARPGQIEAQGTLQLRGVQNGKSVEVRTSSDLLLDPQLNPLSYTWSQKGAQSSHLSIDFRAHPAHTHYTTVDGKDDRRDFGLDKDVVVLDDNAIHQYELALARYAEAKGGTQAFRAFIPQEALPGIITVNYVGPEAITVAGEKRTLRRFLLTTELAQINLWVDEHGRLQVVAVPDVQFQAVRKK